MTTSKRLCRHLPAVLSIVLGWLLTVQVTCGATIDEILAQTHAQAGMEPSEVCDDATFLRRLSLDLIGRVPSEQELRTFLAQPDRRGAVDRLLSDPAHAEFWSQLWTSMLIGRGQPGEIERELLRAWLQQCIQEGMSLDQMAFQLITAQGVTALNGPVNYVAASRESPVMSLSRTFLSVQLDCAQCHDHPHDRWTSDDYNAMQRFFTLTRFREISGGISVTDEGPNPNAQSPVFLTGRQPHTSAWRRELGMMVVTSKPFSRAMVNRTWHWLMGRGIIDPVDALSRENPAEIPDLLEQLATDLREDRYDATSLVRRICLSSAYQRSPVNSVSSDAVQQRRLFAARTVRPLLPEQWIASLAIVLDRPAPSPADVAQRSNQLMGIGRQATPGSDPFAWSPTSQTLIRQLSADMPAPVRDLDSLFLVTLARRPTEAERRLVADADSASTLFALVHGNEFTLND